MRTRPADVNQVEQLLPWLPPAVEKVDQLFPVSEYRPDLLPPVFGLHSRPEITFLSRKSSSVLIRFVLVFALFGLFGFEHWLSKLSVLPHLKFTGNVSPSSYPKIRKSPECLLKVRRTFWEVVWINIPSTFRHCQTITNNQAIDPDKCHLDCVDCWSNAGLWQLRLVMCLCQG